MTAEFSPNAAYFKQKEAFAQAALVL